MNKENVLFISNRIFLDSSSPMGGVKLCTLDYLDLLNSVYNVVPFPVNFNRNLFFRIKSRLGIDSYEEYDTGSYATQLQKVIKEHSIRLVFINLSNATDFSRVIKERIGKEVKVILCSHGNESGDFLHQSVRFKDKLSVFQRVTSPYRLGKVLQKELLYRLRYIDLVLTVSEIEDSIEKWVGANKVFMVPRVLRNEFVDWMPENKRVGFIGDISHYPNYYGVLKLCESLKPYENEVELRIVGKNNSNMEELKSKFNFITHLGYLDENEVLDEVATWNYFLNLVFYYSKGVSTKLAQGLDWGLPVISTTPGNRGYILSRPIPTFDEPAVMAKEIIERMRDKQKVKEDRQDIIDIVQNTISYHAIMQQLQPTLNGL